MKHAVQSAMLALLLRGIFLCAQDKPTPTEQKPAPPATSSQQALEGPVDVLSDTMGVNFGPYINRVLHDVRQKWLTLIPEAARRPIMKRGKVTIEFAILKDGSVRGMRLVGPSRDVSLDRAAWGGIVNSSPFPPLPAEFGGQYLALRFHFFYNPGKSDIDNTPVGSAPLTIPPAPLTISPSGTVKVPIGGSQQFTATVNATGDKAVIWNLSGCNGAVCGTISSSGLYTAPAKLPNPPNVTVMVTLGAAPLKTASAVVTIVRPDPTR